MKTVKYDFRFLIHNTVLHFVAGWFWFFGFNDVADKIHNAIE